MKDLEIKMKNCFGIGDLENSFSFSEGNIVGVYARNGLMKTSFAKTFDLVSKGKESEIVDHINGKKHSLSVKIDGMKMKDYTSILVIESLKDTFIYDEENISPLLVNEELKIKYDTLISTIETKKEVLLKIITTKSRNGKETENIFCKDFEKKNIYETFCFLHKENEEALDKYDGFKYKDVFNKDTGAILDSEETKGILQEYVKNLRQIIDKKKYFSGDGFNPTNARVVFEIMKKNSFFSPKNSINLIGEESSLDQDSFDTLLKEIESDISSSVELQNLAEKITKKVGTKEFQDLMVKNPIIIESLSKFGVDEFKKELWRFYLKDEKENLTDFVEYYEQNISTLKEIEKEAEKEKSEWDKTIEVYNSRFRPKFKVELIEKNSAILGQKIPTIVFKFGDDDKRFTNKELQDRAFLSQGEKRVLYLLYVVFEIKKRVRENIRTILISDDISDSFDYKNKNIILQYLRDVSKYKYKDTDEKLFYQIILTHNFDFFRSIRYKLEAPIQNLYFTEKDKKDSVSFNTIGENIMEPFNNFIENANKEIRSNIALIPFARNLAEYMEGVHFGSLSDILHYRSKGKAMKLSCLNKILNNYIKRHEEFALKEIFTPKEDFFVFSIIDKIAQDVVKRNEKGLNLQDKLLLSMAIRLESEKFMEGLLDGKTKDKDIRIEKLFIKAVDQELLTDEHLETLDLIMISTAEYLHINSFMYEPLIDTPLSELIDLYGKIKKMNGSEKLL